MHMLEAEIIVKGWIDEAWCEWLGGLWVSYSETGQTVLTGVLLDEAALYGILARMRDLGFHIISIRIEAIEKDND
jgi:hypothetical protein